MKIIDIPQPTLALLSQRTGADEAWPKPENPQCSLPPVRPFQDDLLPSPLSDYVKDEANRMQAPPDFVAVALIASLGSVIGTGCSVRPKQKDSWYEHPNLSGGVVGGPSAMKSPAGNAGCLALRYLESDAQEHYEAQLVRYVSDQEEREYEKKLLKSPAYLKENNISQEQALSRIRELNQPLSPPVLRRYFTSDSTIEKLAELIRDSPRGILIHRDELVSLLESCNKQGHEADRGFYLEGCNGKYAYVTDRIGRGNTRVKRLCLSVFGGIQPARLQNYVAGTVAGYDNDGLLQRLQLMVYPDPILDWQYVDQEPNLAVRDEIIRIFRVLADTDFMSLGATADGDNPPYFRFGPSAQKGFVTWLTDLQSQVRNEDFSVMAEHLGKYSKLIPALALIFHLVETVMGVRHRTPGISKVALERAIRWGTYLESHARRIYGLGLDPVVNAANDIIRKIQSGDLTEDFSERDVYKSGWSGLNDAGLVHAACEELEQAGWIRRIQVPRGNGRPPSPSYQINPKALSK